MKFARTPALKFLLGLSVSAICLYYAVRGINFHALVKTFLTVKIPYLLLFLLCLLGAVLLRAVIYRRFLSRKGTAGLFSIFEGLVIGYMVNSIFPLRAGDVVKAYIIGRLNNTSKTYTFTLVIIERLFDMITLLIFFLILLCMVKLDNRFRSAAQILAAVIFMGLLFIFLNIRWGGTIRTLINRLGFILPRNVLDKINDRLEIFQSGFRIFCDWRDLLFIQGIFLLIWGFYICGTYVTGLAVGIPLGLTFILFLLVAVCFGTAIASSPGGLGVHQYACVLVFSYFHYSREDALTFSLINNTLSFIMPIILGWLFLLHTNISLASLSQTEEEKAETPSTPGVESPLSLSQAQEPANLVDEKREDPGESQGIPHHEKTPLV
jgi:glycosyltransferase 2 family protein